MVLIYVIVLLTAGYGLIFGSGTALFISSIVTILALIADRYYDKRPNTNS